MELNERVNKLEDDVKIIKNEVQAVLLDIRESYLNRENPFNPEVSSPTLHSVAATISGQSVGPAGSAGTGKPSHEAPPAENAEESDEEETEEEAGEVIEQPVAQGKKVATASEAKAGEEVKKAMRSEAEPEVTEMREVPVKKNGHIQANGKLDIATIAGLTKWVGGAVGIIGKARTETVLDFAEVTGHLPAEVKNTLVKFINRVPENGNGNGNGHSGNGNGYKAFQLVTSLIELEGLIGMDNQCDELTLLAMVCQEVDQ